MDNVVSLTGYPIVAGDQARQDFLDFVTKSYDMFAQGVGDKPQSYVLTLATDSGVFDTYWSNYHSKLPMTAVCGFALGALTTAVASQAQDYQKPKD